MLVYDSGDSDVFFDSVDSLSPQESVLTKQDFGYEIWVNEPLSVKERRESFLKGMGFADASTKASLLEKSNSFGGSSTDLGMERIRACNGSVSNPCISYTDQIPERFVPSRWETTSEAQILLDELKSRPGDRIDTSFRGTVCGEAEAREESRDFGNCKRKKKNWWKFLMNRTKEGGGEFGSKLNKGTTRTQRINVKQNKKRWMEFGAMYIGQEIRAHKGLIWAMKFSPNGQYLASGGEDGVVRIWRVISLDSSSIFFAAKDSAVGKLKHDVPGSQKKHPSQSFIVLPNKIFQIEESPLQEFYGHSSDVLDLAWSSSDILISSSMDKTVRMWQVGCNQCLSVFHHKDYVTCIQFNPVDENYFISGSIDGKVRIWGIREERVVDWADIRDVISAICYQPDGNGFVVGSLTGACRFYVASGKHFQLEVQIYVNGKKRTSGNKITSIQFSEKNHRRVMITSEDSKVRILEGVELIQTYKGLPRSGSQMSGSFTSSGRHIVSVGNDSRVYIWNYNDNGNASSKQTKSNHSCEYFSSKGVTVAIPWSGNGADSSSSSSNISCNKFGRYSSEIQHRSGSERFSFGSWFSIDGGSCRGSTTWPEEKLPVWDLPLVEDELDHKKLCLKESCNLNCVSETWGLSIVAAGCDGTIKTFHNFGLPFRL